MSNIRWKIGLVGVGRGSGYGKLFAEHPDCQVVACCDSSEQALAQFQKELGLADSACFTQYETFLGMPMDAVFIGTPIPAHADQAVKAMEAGVHVLSEVTAAATVEDCFRIVAAVRKAKKIYMFAENCVYWPFVQEWKSMIAASRIGEVFYAKCEYLHPIRSMIVDPVTGAPRCGVPIVPNSTTVHIRLDRSWRSQATALSVRWAPGRGTGSFPPAASVESTSSSVCSRRGREP